MNAFALSQLCHETPCNTGRLAETKTHTRTWNLEILLCELFFNDFTPGRYSSPASAVCQTSVCFLTPSVCLSPIHHAVKCMQHAACCSEPETDRAKTRRRRHTQGAPELQDHSYTRLRPYHSLHEKGGDSAPPFHLY